MNIEDMDLSSCEGMVYDNPQQGPTIILDKDELLYRLTRLLADWDSRYLDLYMIHRDLTRISLDEAIPIAKRDYAKSLIKQINDSIWR